MVFRLLILIGLLLLAREEAKAQAGLPIYTNDLVNGFQDWSWGTHNLSNTNPIYSGTYSISASFVAWEALEFHCPDLATTGYSNLTFWANGGTNGGQILWVSAQLDNTNSLPFYTTSVFPTNSWKQFTIPLTTFGAANQSNLVDFIFKLTSSGRTNTFYLDDIQLSPQPAPAVVHINVNASQVVRTVDARWFGINADIWDGDFDTPQTIAKLTEMGTLALRWPGGSASDQYHWSTDATGKGTNAYVWPTSEANFIHVATNLNAQVITTVNYGTGSTNEAAAWVAYVNGSTTNTLALGTDQFGTNWQTVGYWASLRAAAPLAKDDGKNFLRISRTTPIGFKYWEIGNECYGTWETDSNTVPHDPYTYATRVQNYFALMKTVDASIKIGVDVTPGEDTYSNNPNHYAVNPFTGQPHYGWTPVMFSTLKTLGVTPDFGSHHSYAPGDCDPALLQFAEGVDGWASDAANLTQMLTNYLGGTGSNVELCVTENNTGSSGKQLTSLVNGIYAADSLANLMKTPFNSFLWWDLRNGPGTNGDMDPTIYGWRLYGDLGVLNGLTKGYPAFYVPKLLQYFARPGDRVLKATSDYSLLSAYAVRRASGAVTLLVLHKDPTTNFLAQISISGFIPTSAATLISYGMPQDNAADTGIGSQDLLQTNFNGASTTFNYTFAPYSASLFTFNPSAPVLTILPTTQQSPRQIVFQLQGQSSVQYIIQSSTNLTTWISVATNTLTGSTLNFTNPVSSSRTACYWRALWSP